MLGLFFKKQPLLDEATIQWLFDAYAWALKNFGTDVFYKETALVEPSNKCFPGQSDSVEAMAQLILTRVKHYAGLDYWPTQGVDHRTFDGDAGALIDARHALQDGSHKLTLFYEPEQVGNPNAMIANYAHALAHHMAPFARDRAPCEQEQWPHMMELLGVYMGFGIMFVNTAVPQRQTCGSCCSPAAQRQGAMTEMEVIYALAIFCALKEIPAKAVVPHIKAYLKPLLKKAIKDVYDHADMLAALKAIESPSRVRGTAVGKEWQGRIAAAQSISLAWTQQNEMQK